MRDMQEDSNKNDEKYNLYTEKITNENKLNPNKKKLSNRGIIILSAVGTFIIIFLIFALPKITWWINHKVNAGYSQIKIDNNSGEGEDININVDNNDTNKGTDNYQQIVSSMRERVNVVKKSIVKVDTSYPSLSETLSANKPSNEKNGVLIGKTKTRYVILTSSEYVKDQMPVKVKFDEKTSIQGVYLAKNETSGIALVSVKINDIPADVSERIQSIKIGNSEKLSQGNFTFAYGELNSSLDSLDYGIITGIDEKSINDNSIREIRTNIKASQGDFSFIFDKNGYFLGVAHGDGASKTLNGYGINDLKDLVEKLSKGTDLAYAGIIGKNITSDLAGQYNLPLGIYIQSVAVDSPVYKAGIQAGDIIVSMGDVEIKNLEDFNKQLYNYNIGQVVEIGVKRQGKDGYTDIRFNVVLSELKANR